MCNQLVIFDCDGVLVDSEVLFIDIDQRVLAELGWSISREEIIDRFVGHSHEHFVKVVEEHIGRNLPDDWEDAFQHLYRESFAQELQTVEGVVEALDVIKTPSCVASNGAHEKIRFSLGLTGLLPRFEGRIFSASDVARGKPAPDLFQFAASRLGHETSNCIVVEDSWAGVSAALAANMKVIAYAGGVTPRDKLQGEGILVIDHMSQLPEALDALTSN